MILLYQAIILTALIITDVTSKLVTVRMKDFFGIQKFLFLMF